MGGMQLPADMWNPALANGGVQQMTASCMGFKDAQTHAKVDLAEKFKESGLNANKVVEVVTKETGQATDGLGAYAEVGGNTRHSGVSGAISSILDKGIQLQDKRTIDKQHTGNVVQNDAPDRVR